MNITILEFLNAKTYIRKVPTEIQHLDGDEILEHFANELGFRAGDVQYIISDVENFDTDIDIITEDTKEDIDVVVEDGLESAIETFEEAQEDGDPELTTHWTLSYMRLIKLIKPEHYTNWLD